MPYEVIGETVLVEVDPLPEKYGSIHLPHGKIPDSLVKCTVIHVGDKVKNVKKDDRILKLNNLGTMVKNSDKSKEYCIIMLDNVIAILTGEEALKSVKKEDNKKL